MSKGRTIATASATLVLGLLIGGWAATKYWVDFHTNFMTTGLTLSHLAGANERLALLSSIHSGQPEEAVRTLNVLLDGDALPWRPAWTQVPIARR
jgi:hypothetical protein